VSEWLALGHVIDLGGTRLEIMHTPGHSPDSVLLLAIDANILFAADFIYPGPLYVQVLRGCPRELSGGRPQSSLALERADKNSPRPWQATL
jgi:glyoxylase-like metal-dependent hydrolase (beta-lactamase superfamily II)